MVSRYVPCLKATEDVATARRISFGICSDALENLLPLCDPEATARAVQNGFDLRNVLKLAFQDRIVVFFPHASVRHCRILGGS